jgi:phage tail sheath protein FI
MPEYLAPGVYVEEVSFRSKSIEGVSTSTAGFVGPARTGPISGRPELLTSFADFEKIYGNSDPLNFGGTLVPNYLAHAVRAFYAEGGVRLYVTRVYNSETLPEVRDRHAQFVLPAGAVAGSPQVTLIARFPGEAGRVAVTFTAKVGRNVLNTAGTRSLSRVREFDLVIADGLGSMVDASLRVVRRSPSGDDWVLSAGGTDTPVTEPSLVGVRQLTVLVEVSRPFRNADGTVGYGPPELLGEFGFDPRAANGLSRVLSINPPTRQQALTLPIALELNDQLTGEDAAITLAGVLFPDDVLAGLADETPPVPTRSAPTVRLTDGSDGAAPDPATYEGRGANFFDLQNVLVDLPRNGLLAFESAEDISIVAAPAAAAGTVDDAAAIQGAVIRHCHYMRYRIAVLDTSANLLPTEALDYRNRTSSTHAALYYPWVIVADPLDGSRLPIPPSGFVAGIYARNDIQRAVFKAPANEVVRSAVDLENRLNKAHQELLNPEGVNCLRFFPGRGFLLFGARTISDDPEWKYVNLRRYFAYLERSIDTSTQWVIFEVNSERLWANVRQTVEDFLYNEWKMGGLLGDDPKKAYFVRCDMTTMTQNDLDNGRLVCLIGVAAVKPAEFVIFRIGQWTASSGTP